MPDTRNPTPETRVAIIGLGYVGLPLCLQFVRSGQRVIGVDIDPKKVELLNAGKSYIQHIGSEPVSEAVETGRFSATADFAQLAKANAIIICVPTPLGKNREPDLNFVTKTAKSIGQNLSPGTLVVLESTTYPGTTEDVLRPILESESGLTAGEDFYLAFSPEREDPGNPDSAVGKVPKVVGGFTETCLQHATELYSHAVETVVPVSSCRTAEATKLTENIFRSVNIALVNELKVVFAAMGVDVWEVIDAAKTKPFGFMPFYPGPGLGGHCIPIDPFYLTWKAREYGLSTRFIELAGEVNTAMPKYVVSRVAEALNSNGKAVNGSRILVLGLAYKANVDDTRESPSFVLMEHLKSQGAEVSYHDPHVPVIPRTREHAQWEGVKSIEWNQSNISSYDAVLISTAHQCIDYAELAAWSKTIIDTRNVMSTISASNAKIWNS